MKFTLFHIVFIAVLTLGIKSTDVNASTAQSLTSKIDRSSLAIDETLQLTITFSGANTNSRPNLNLLNSDFDVLSSNQSSIMQNFNGRINTSTDWNITLAPKRLGRLIIPSFNVDGAISDALEVNVEEAKPLAQGQQRDIFIETITDKEKIYVQEQLKITHRLAFDATINIDSLDAEPLELIDTVIEKLPDTKYQKNINGKLYYVYEYSYAVFPQSSGELVIPSLRWNLRIAKTNRRSIFNNIGNYELKRQRTDKKTITVKPKPVIFPANKPWLPAEKLLIDERWSADPSTFNLGEPLTRTIILQAHGLTSSQLPNFTQAPNTNDIKFYADKPVLKDEQKEDGVISQRIESAAIVAAKTGNVTIPGEEIPWWNTTTDTLEYLRIEPRIISVQGSTTNVSTIPELTNTTQTNSSSEISITENSNSNTTSSTTLRLWQLISLFFAVLSAIFAYIAFFRKSQNQTTTNTKSASQTLYEITENQAWNSLSRYLNGNDLTAARKQLIIWFSILTSTQSATMDEIINTIDDSNLKLQLKKIDQALYGNQEDTNIPTELADKLGEYRKKIIQQRKSKHTDDTILASLHPTKIA